MDPQTFANEKAQTLSILKNIAKNEGHSPIIESELNFSTIGYPVLIGSRAAKWHIPSFREPNDWDFIATSLQSILFINKVTVEEMKLIHYPGVGLKIIGKCERIESSAVENSTNFEIELASDKMNLKELKLNEIMDDCDDNMEIDNQKGEQLKTSAQMILELCQGVEDKMMFPFPFIVAPLSVLEALKSSHIYWPANFYKHIEDLHSLRIILNCGNQLPITEPLCSPSRNEKTELMLKTRIKETEMMRGVPGAHINLNKTNEEFLDREDDLFVQRRVPHDELHERVKYGDLPIYETLKNDKSKAWINKSMFQKIDYQKQLNCVKEEAMVIALERYIIPMISKNQETSYRSALIRICTSLTKGWFRQFTIDNYPRLLNLDKDLLSIAQNIIDKTPLKEINKEDPSALLHKWIHDLETRAIFEPIYSHTEIISSFEELGTPPSCRNEFKTNRTGLKITSPINKDISITAVITTVCLIDFRNCQPGADWWASVSIVPSEDLERLSKNSEENSSGYHDPLDLHPFDHNIAGYRGYYVSEPRAKRLKFTSKNIFVLEINAKTSGESWGVAKDIWSLPEIRVGSADHIASKLEIPGFTGDLLFRYVLAYLQPCLENNGSTPLKYHIDGLKAKGRIPVKPQQHLWYDAWNYNLQE